MTRLAVSLIALSAFSGVAVAANLGGSSYGGSLKDGYTAPAAYRWDGIYIGGHLGWGWAKSSGGLGCDSIRRILRGVDNKKLLRYQPEDQGVCDKIKETKVKEDTDNPKSPNVGETLPYFPLGLDDDDDITRKNFVALVDQSSEDTDSFMGGVQIASLHQFGSIVLGLEADWSSASDMKSKTTGSFEYFGQINDNQLWEYFGAGQLWFKSELDWLATFRAKLGAVLSSDGRLLGYVTGGAAVAKVSVSNGGVFEAARHCVNACRFGQGDSDTLYQFGGVIGAGLEYALTDNFSIGAEYLYVSLTGQDKKSINFFDNNDSRQFSVTDKVGFDDIHTFKVKANLKFGG